MSTDGGSISRHQNQAPALPPDTQLPPNLTVFKCCPLIYSICNTLYISYI